MDYARHQFTLAETQDDGQPLIEHLLAVQKRTGEVHSLIAEAPPIPDGLEALWDHFLALHDSRGSNGWGPSRITFADMDAYQRLTGNRLDAWQVDAVRKVDNVWLADFAPKQKEAR